MHVVMVCAESLLGVVVWLISAKCKSLSGRNIGIVFDVGYAHRYHHFVVAFMPQILAHLFAFVVVYATLRRDRWGAICAGLALTGVVWTHIGEILIIAVWYVGLRLSEADRGRPAWWWRWLPVVSLPLSATPLYVNYVQTLMQAAPPVTHSVPMQWAAMLTQIKEGLAVGFAPIIWWLTPLLAFVAWRRLPQLVPAWVVTIVFWLVVELVTGYQVRYGYVAVPLIAIGLAYCLTPLTRYAQVWLDICDHHRTICDLGLCGTMGGCYLVGRASSCRWVESLGVGDYS
jgi:hypothetical protein